MSPNLFFTGGLLSPLIKVYRGGFKWCPNKPTIGEIFNRYQKLVMTVGENTLKGHQFIFIGGLVSPVIKFYRHGLEWFPNKTTFGVILNRCQKIQLSKWLETTLKVTPFIFYDGLVSPYNSL